MDKLDPSDPRAPYVQVAERLRGQLREEAYRVGDKLPPHQAIADEFGVSVGTVKRAYGLLQEEALIVTRQGQGTFVRATGADVPADAPAPPDALTRQLADVQRRLEALERHVGLRPHG
ncbi:GntR family transcriptional regulator [Amycolatopsis suaedae]|uniref:GntR family transcriptional regulator n=1 Tax=Amycolatopsis suaedae TaxID=2510978 RepID=A0A4Q7JBH5_9PSEU|nr:GntR family transcriptional regulator [Amycolatopsis suaedae]RZQ64366.1 GntR family transcriptional regulator [Amycolatopsis suaedae]